MIDKIIAQYQKYGLVSATKNIIYHCLTRERKKSFGSLNSDKTFYVIRSIADHSRFYIGPRNNLLANYFYVLSHLKYALLKGWIPVVDQLNYPVYNSVKYPINGTVNAWEYYWKQPSPYTLEEVYQSKNVILSKQNWFSEYDMGYKLSNYKDKSLISQYCALSNYIQYKDIVSHEIKDLTKNILPEGKRILGVNFRFGGHSKRHYGCAEGHPLQPDIEEMLPIIKKVIEEKKIDLVFAASDVHEALDLLQVKLGNKLIYLPRKRSTEHIKKGEPNPLYDKVDTYNVAIEYLSEMELLAKTTCIIGSINSGFRYALLRNNNRFEKVEVLNYGLHERK